MHNDVIANSDVTYSFDALGRTTNRSINGSSNSIDWTYDAMSRVTSEDNALGLLIMPTLMTLQGLPKAPADWHLSHIPTAR